MRWPLFRLRPSDSEGTEAMNFSERDRCDSPDGDYSRVKRAFEIPVASFFLPSRLHVICINHNSSSPIGVGCVNIVKINSKHSRYIIMRANQSFFHSKAALNLEIFCLMKILLCSFSRSRRGAVNSARAECVAENIRAPERLSVMPSLNLRRKNDSIKAHRRGLKTEVIKINHWNGLCVPC